ncbi:MAG: hypothetical protein NUW37_01385 [Planctomycetes bacterium]|nr:hypothetical protein [Planctomycetota bacterium]
MLQAVSIYPHDQNFTEDALRDFALGYKIDSFSLTLENFHPLKPWAQDAFWKRKANAVCVRNAAGRELDEALSASPDPANRARFVSALAQMAHIAECVKSPVIVLEPRPALILHGHDPAAELFAAFEKKDDAKMQEVSADLRKRQNERSERLTLNLCRSVHDALKTLPDNVGIAFSTPAHPLAFPFLRDIVTLFGEFRTDRLSYFHDTYSAEYLSALGFESQESWLKSLDTRLAGAFFSDFNSRSGKLGRLPPGAGSVDWKLISNSLAEPTIRVLDLPRDASAFHYQMSLEYLRLNTIF